MTGSSTHFPAILAAGTRAILLCSMFLAGSQAVCQAVFRSSATANQDWQNWEVATNLPGNPADGANIDGQYSSFPVNGPFVPARPVSVAPDWISNVESGSNGSPSNLDGNWTFFVFRQSFYVSAAEIQQGLTLSFRWAADDSGTQMWSQGSWTPKWSLNSTSEPDLVRGIWHPDPPTEWPGPTYSLGPVVSVSGFREGNNTLYFFVEGNGTTDGMSLMNAQFGAVPEPSSYMAIAGVGLAGLGVLRRLRR